MFPESHDTDCRNLPNVGHMIFYCIYLKCCKELKLFGASGADGKAGASGAAGTAERLEL